MEGSRTGRRQALRVVGVAGVGLALVAGDSLLRGRGTPGGGTSPSTGAGRLPGLAAGPAHAQPAGTSPSGKPTSVTTVIPIPWSQPPPTSQVTVFVPTYVPPTPTVDPNEDRLGLLGLIGSCASIVVLCVTAVGAIGAITVAGLRRG